VWIEVGIFAEIIFVIYVVFVNFVITIMSKFINPSLVVAQSGLMQCQVVADLGCGSGFYAVPAAQMVGKEGVVFAVDVQEAKLAATVSIANQFGVKNIKVVRADLAKPLLDIPTDSCDLVMIGNILHEINDKTALIQNTYRILKTGGKVLVVEWKRTATPFGPPLQNRVDQQQLEIMLMTAGLRKERELQADGYHYSVLFTK
jgi:ubiquinone/menaquinone biosynthesis C-methylase UbiE